MQISKTPLRISLFGGGTDFPEYFKNNKSLIIGSSIDKYIYITFNQNTELSDKKIKIFYKKNQFVNSVNDISHQAIKYALKKYYKNKKNIELHLAADLPSSAGLGSSSAFATGLINLLRSINYKKNNKKSLAYEVINFERNILKENVGYQDQIHSAYGGFNFIEIYKNKFNVKPYKNTQLLDKLNKNLFLVFTCITRKASFIEKKKIDLFNVNYNLFKQIAEISFEARNVFTEKYHIDEIGNLLDFSWSLKKKLSNNVSNEILDSIYNDAIKNGSSGGKILGAGAGGFFVFYVPKNKQPKFKIEMNKKYKIVDFKFDNTGSQILKI